MEFIFKNINTNKVTIPIITNLYEEINNYVEEENLFNSIENIIDVYQNIKKITSKNIISKVNTFKEKRNRYNY
jgi:hypothetical protein